MYTPFIWLAALSIFFPLFLLPKAQAIPVYRALDSRYNSGSASLSQLEEKTEKIIPQIWRQVLWQKRKYWVQNEEILSPLHFAKQAIVKKKLSARVQPNLKVPATQPLRQGQTLNILSHHGSWVEVNTKKGQRSYWLEASDLIAKKPLTEFAFTMDRTILYQTPSESAKILTLLNPETRLKIISIAKKWLRVRFGHLTGYTLKEQMIGHWPHHKHKKGQAKLLSGPLGTKLYLQPNIHNPAGDEIASGIPLHSISQHRQLWGQAKIEHIGDVWWKIEKLSQKSSHTEALSSKDFFQREIFDMLRSPTDKSLVIASAQGIFRSSGDLWERIDHFQDRDHPLAASSSGVIFVGPYLSRDGAKTFQPYIRWDQFLKSLQLKFPQTKNYGLSKIRLLEISPLDHPGRKVKLRLAVNKESLFATTENSGDTWTFSK